MRASTYAIPVVLALVALAVLAWLVRKAQPRLAFFPHHGEDVTPRSSGVDYEAHVIVTSDGERLILWRLPRRDARATVVYFHGNGGNLSMWCDVLVGLWRRHFEVVAIDYRGYGLSTGRPSEPGLYRDVDATLQFVHQSARRADIPLLYWGRSLGATMAAYAASRRAPDGVILENGFPHMRAVLETNPLLWLLSWLSTYRFATADWMASVTQPALVIHGDRDSVIPYRLGQRLHTELQGPKKFVTIPGGDHNEALPADPAVYWGAIETFVAEIASASGRR